MGSETWTNDTMPSDILPRKSAELVWIPVGQQGMLVAIGGSVNRDGNLYRTDVYDGYRTEGQGFVDSVNLYDIANKAWCVSFLFQPSIYALTSRLLTLSCGSQNRYTQKTFGEKLPPTAEFCTVAASSKDGKSHQVSNLYFIPSLALYELLFISGCMATNAITLHIHSTR